jgi:2-polyprenyl-6-methoxyphenol hydroxylase-like FAD-dependent oxidoreductase
MQERLDALVVGAGPTGLTMACELLRRGMRVRVIDASPGPSRHSKALVVQVRTLELFERMGVLAAVQARGQAMVGINVMGRRGSLGRIGIGVLPGRFPAPVMLEQNVTEEILEARLVELGGLVERDTTLLGYSEDAAGVTATVRAPGGEQTITAAWLLGCDGAHSAVRRLAGIPFIGSEYHDIFDQTDLKIRWSRPRDEGFGFFRDRGVVVVLPLPRGRYRVLCIGGEHPPAEPTLADFQRIVAEVAPDAELYDPEWVVRFRLHLRMVPRMREGRALVAGDAAHIHSPAGGQGMNTGIQDAYNLAWKLALVQQGRAKPGLLDSYGRERSIAAAQVLGFSDAAFRRALASGRMAAWARSLLLRAVLPLAAIARTAAATISQTRINYRDAGTGLDARSWPRRGPRPGDRAPDAPLACPEGQTQLFHRLAAAPCFALLLLPGARPDPALDAAADQLVARWPGLIDRLTVFAGPGADGLRDVSGALYREYAPRGPELLLIRPDGHIAARAPRSRTAAIGRCLELLLTTGSVPG